MAFSPYTPPFFRTSPLRHYDSLSETPTALTKTTFPKVGRSGINVGRHSDYYPNEAR